MATMAEGERGIELKFRIFDGTDIVQRRYPLSTTVAMLKDSLFSEWPQDKSVILNSVNDLKIIHSGQVLPNGQTINQTMTDVGVLLGGEVTTMHVVVQRPVERKRRSKLNFDVRRRGFNAGGNEANNEGDRITCSCTIL